MRERPACCRRQYSLMALWTFTLKTYQENSLLSECSGLLLVLKQRAHSVEVPRFLFLVTSGKDSFDITEVLPGWFKELTVPSHVSLIVSSLVVNTLAMTFISHLSVVTVCHFRNFLEIEFSGLWPLKILLKANELWKWVVCLYVW